MEGLRVADEDLKAEFRHAVLARGLSRSYGSGNNQVKVIEDMDLTLEVGKIYGLLGEPLRGPCALARPVRDLAMRPAATAYGRSAHASVGARQAPRAAARPPFSSVCWAV